MKIISKAKEWCEKNEKYWYILISIPAILEIANTSFLCMVIPLWICSLISILLVCVFAGYIGIMYSYLKSKYKKYINEKEDNIFKRIEEMDTNINTLFENQTILLNKHTKLINENINTKSSEAVNRLNNNINDSTILLKTSLNSYEKTIIETTEKNSKRIIDFSKQQFTNSNSRNENNFKNVNILFTKQIKNTEDIAQKHNNEIISAVSSITDSIAKTETLTKNMLDDIEEKLEGISKIETKNSEALISMIDDSKRVINNAIEETKFELDDKLSEMDILLHNHHDGCLDIMNSIDLKLNNISNDENELSEKITFATSEIMQSIQSVSIQFENTLEKMEEYDLLNIERFKNLSSDIEQTIFEKTEILSNVIAQLQTIVIELHNQTIDNIGDYNDRVDNLYNGTFNQIKGFSTSVKSMLEKATLTLNKQEQKIENISQFCKQSAENQLEQNNESKLELLEDIKANQTSLSDIRSRIENLQNQLISLNRLSQIIKYISDSSSNYVGKEPNRVEEIVDEGNKIKVNNHYKRNILVKSEMFTNNKLSYVIDYSETGSIVATRNYELDGKVSTELTFYPNGQVKTRLERVKVSGKFKLIKSTFDENGNKIKEE